jgi:hypothetical protein
MYTIVPVHDFHHQTVVLDGAASLSSALDGAASLPSALDGAAPEGGAAFEGPLVARALAGATQVALAVTTIGPALEEQVDELFKVDPVRALALDGAGVAAIGAVSKMVVDRIRAEASARGLGSGMRASPGQEGWSIWQQRALFSVVPAGQIGVCLADTCLMLPRKSNSFVVGLGPEMQPGAVTCDFCSKRGRCPWRVR